MLGEEAEEWFLSAELTVSTEFLSFFGKQGEGIIQI